MINENRAREIDKFLEELYQEELTSGNVDRFKIYRKLVNTEDNLNKKIINDNSKKKVIFSNEDYPNEVLTKAQPVKIYLSVNDMYVNGIYKLILKRLNDLNIKYDVLLCDFNRTDQLAITLPDIDSAKTVIDEINNNLFITQNVVRLNPFMITIGSVNVTLESLYGFNGELSIILEKYIKYIVEKNEKPNLNGLIEYMNNYVIQVNKRSDYDEVNVKNDLINFIFVSLQIDDIDSLESYYNNSYLIMIRKKDVNDRENNNMTLEEIEKYLQEHILVTEKKMGKEHLMLAIKNYIDYGYDKGFSRIMINGVLSREVFKYRLAVIRLLEDMYGLNKNNECLQKK